MQMLYKNRIFDILLDADHNLLVATYNDPEKFKTLTDPKSGKEVKSIGYADIFSVSTPISDNAAPYDKGAILFEAGGNNFALLFKNLFMKIDERLAQNN